MIESRRPSVGFVGLGLMGYGMAVDLVRKCYYVTGYDVSSSVLSRFENGGGRAAPTISKLTNGNDFYICMVASAPQVQDLLFDNQDALVKSLPQGATFLLCSTVPPAFAKSVEEQLKEHGMIDVYFVDCPVSGGAKRAADGTLTIMAGASAASLEKSMPLLQDMAGPDKLFICGGIGAGSNMKMAHQVLAGIQILAASEAVGFSSKLGANANIVHDAVLASDGWSWMFENRVPRMLAEDYFPGASALAIILKDVTIITRSALDQQFPTPLISVAEQVYLSALTLGFERHDDAGMVRTYYGHAISKAHESSRLSPEEESETVNLTIKLLKAIHLWAAAEAMAFAKQLGINLGQFYKLCIDAAGSTVQFKEVGLAMTDVLQGSTSISKRVEGRLLRGAVEDLNDVVQRASKSQAALHLGSAVRNLMILAVNKLGPDTQGHDLVKFWDEVAA